MLESTLSALLVSAAGRYAHLSASDVGVGLSGGRLVLDNVQLRADALNAHAIPCHILHGRAGRLRVNVPWSALSHTPVTVYLENVHLVAGPKLKMESRRGKTKTRRKGRGRSRGLSNDDASLFWRGDSSDPASRAVGGEFTERWHETLVGRLGFNVAVEVNGLKVEYRDEETQGIVSLASCKANSADRNWEAAFAPLDAGETGAVAMRKIVYMKGLHCVMLPRSGTGDVEVDNASEGGSGTERGTSVDRRRERRHIRHYAVDDSDIPHRGTPVGLHDVDKTSFEMQNPILDGIGITLKFLLCNSDGPEDGWHLDVDVELEEPLVNLSARQFSWIRNILDGVKSDGTLDFGNRRERRSSKKRSGDRAQSRRGGAAASRDRRSSSTTSMSVSLSKDETRGARGKESVARIASFAATKRERTQLNHAHPSEARNRTALVPSSPSSQSDLGMDKLSDAFDDSEGPEEFHDSRDVRLDEDYSPRRTIAESSPGALSDDSHGDDHSESDSFDEDSDFDVEEDIARSKSGSKQAEVSAQRSSLSSLWRAIIGEGNVDESVDDAAVALGYRSNETPPKGGQASRLRRVPRSAPERSERFEALNAVAMAAEAGGYTLRVRVTTPDFKAREKVAELQAALVEEREARRRLEDVDKVVAEADARVAAASQEVANLRAKNESLVKELEDLERMTRSASASKDVMVRQMEAALRKAERQLQSVAQAQASHSPTLTRPENSSTGRSSRGGERRPRSSRVYSEVPTVASGGVEEGSSVTYSSGGRSALSTQSAFARRKEGMVQNATDPSGSFVRSPLRDVDRQTLRSGDSSLLEDSCSKDGLTVL